MRIVVYCNDAANSVVTLTNNQTISGEKTFSSKITQGSPSTDGTIYDMNRFQADLFVAGNGKAPNSPKVAGFYLGKSQTDENRHMDIVSGDTYSYIDFNKASNVEDYRSRLLVNVDSGLTEWMWASGAASKVFNVVGTIQQSGTNVSLNGHEQPASTITEGELKGKVTANATAAATLSNAQVRNISAGTADLTAGSSSLATGSLYFVYE